MARCKFCSKEITWMKESGRNRPINGDGGLHACEEMKSSMKTIKSIERTDIDLDILRLYETAINDKAAAKKK